jgi:hypothetical protein
MGQFLPVFLQCGLSAANETAQIPANIIDNTIFAQSFMRELCFRNVGNTRLKTVNCLMEFPTE